MNFEIRVIIEIFKEALTFMCIDTRPKDKHDFDNILNWRKFEYSKQCIGENSV